jgi:probable FeS assembly SUF system protein SufT
MDEIISVELKRDCEGIQIPLGTAVTLKAGTPVLIAQTLGGSYTVQCPDGLFRIAARDAEALGLEGQATPAPAAATTPAGAAEPVEEQRIWETLKTCFDPEIPVNIVDLGLVYDLHIETLASGNSRVLVKMTLTASGCGMGTVIASDARDKLLCLPGVEEAEVEIVWDPPWHQSMITAEGRRILGLE